MLRFMITTTPLSTSLQNLKKQSPFGARGKQERIVCHCQITQTSLSLSLSLFQAATMVGSTVFTLAEVASHDNRNDCWLIIEDKVFDHLSLWLNVVSNSLHGFHFLFDLEIYAYKYFLFCVYFFRRLKK